MKVKVRLVGTVSGCSHGNRDYYIAKVVAKDPDRNEDSDEEVLLAVARFFSRSDAEEFVQAQAAFLDIASGNAVN